MVCVLRLSGRQQRELEVLKYFSRSWDIEITEKDIKQFFDWSDRGIKYTQPHGVPTTGKATVNMRPMNGLDRLLHGKIMRDYHIKQWKQDIREGLLFIWELVEDLPKPVIGLMKKAHPTEAWETWEKRPVC